MWMPIQQPLANILVASAMEEGAISRNFRMMEGVLPTLKWEVIRFRRK